MCKDKVNRERRNLKGCIKRVFGKDIDGERKFKKGVLNKERVFSLSQDN